MTRKRLFLLLCVVALLLSLAGLWQWRQANGGGGTALSRGLAALNKGDARTARVELMNAIKADPRSIVARIAQAKAMIDLGDGEAARAEIERARQLGGSASATRHLMAQALLLQGDADGALAEAENADISVEGKGIAARVAGRAWAAKGDMILASQAFDRALRLTPDDVQLWVDVGRFRMTLGDQAGAITAADRAAALAPRNVKALTLRGELTREQYGLTAALPWFEKALAEQPNDVAALEQYAATLADLGRASQMLSVTRRILALEPGNARAWFMQSVMAARAGRTPLARSLLGRTQGRLDGEPATMLLRGVLQLDEGNAMLAAESLGVLVDLQPTNRLARSLLGRALFETGDFASAANVLAPIVAQKDADPYTLTLAARAQEALGNAAMAQDMLARAAWPDRATAVPFASAIDDQIAAGPPPANAGTAQDNIPYIRALLATGRAGEAVERARLLSAANSGVPAAWLVLGDALTSAGRAGEAARIYERAGSLHFSRDAALRLAAAWQRAGNPARAAEVVRLYLSQNPDDVDALRLAAAVAGQAGDWRQALDLLEAVRARIGGNDALLMADLARAALETGDNGKARIYAAHAYRLMPGNPVMADIYGWTLVKTGTANRTAVDLLEKAVALAPQHPVLRAHLREAYGAARISI